MWSKSTLHIYSALERETENSLHPGTVARMPSAHAKTVPRPLKSPIPMQLFTLFNI